MSLFETDAERKAAQTRRRRKALREAENAIDFVKEKSAELRKERDARWQEAGNCLRNGQKAAAQRALTTVRGNDIILMHLDHKRWLFESFVTKMECMDTDTAFAEALSTLSKVIAIEPEQVAQVLDEAAGRCDELKDIDRVWNQEYTRQMNGIAASDVVPDMDEMMKDLERSVVSDIHAGAAAVPAVKPQVAVTPAAPDAHPVSVNRSEVVRNIEKALAGAAK